MTCLPCALRITVVLMLVFGGCAPDWADSRRSSDGGSMPPGQVPGEPGSGDVGTDGADASDGKQTDQDGKPTGEISNPRTPNDGGTSDPTKLPACAIGTGRVGRCVLR